MIKLILSFVARGFKHSMFLFYSYCGNRAPARTKSFGSKDFGLVVDTFIKGWPQVHELKEQVFSNWLASVGSASDYPVFPNGLFMVK